jgi:hypothetical protein
LTLKNPEIDDELGNNIVGTTGNTDNIMATTSDESGNNIVSTTGNTDNIMAATSDELGNGMLDDTTVDGGGK